MEAMALRETKYSPEFSQRSASKRGQHIYNLEAAKNFLSRSVRARRRGAFLKTYTLSSLDNSSELAQPKCNRVKKAAAKIKSVLVSAVEVVRNSSTRLRGCTSRSAICPSSSIQFQKRLIRRYLVLLFNFLLCCSNI